MKKQKERTKKKQSYDCWCLAGDNMNGVIRYLSSSVLIRAYLNVNFC